MSDPQDATTAIKLFADLSTTPTHKDGVLLIAKMLRQERHKTRTRTLGLLRVIDNKSLDIVPSTNGYRALRKAIRDALKASSGEERGETE